MLYKCKDTMATETKHMLTTTKVGLLFPHPGTLWQTNAFFCEAPALGRAVQGDAGGRQHHKGPACLPHQLIMGQTQQCRGLLGIL